MKRARQSPVINMFSARDSGTVFSGTREKHSTRHGFWILDKKPLVSEKDQLLPRLKDIDKDLLPVLN